MANSTNKPMTIYDIARLSGFSRSTISLVLNDSPRISEKTRKKVLDVMEKYDYQPNVLARRFAERKSRMLGVVVPQSSHVFADLYFAEAISGISDVLMTSGYKLMLQVAVSEFKEKKMYLNLFNEKYIDGMLILGGRLSDEMVTELRDLGHPIMLVNSNFDGVSSVVADNQKGAFLAVEHLIRLGHRKIGTIKGLQYQLSGTDRFTGYVKAMKQHGLSIKDEWIANGTYSEDSGYVCMQHILAQRQLPTAMFIANDLMAIGAMRAIRLHGLRVPHDIAIVGVDDIVLDVYIDPPLTTIKQDMYEIGSLAASELLAMIQKESKSLVHKIVPMELIVRKSCGIGIALPLSKQ